MTFTQLPQELRDMIYRERLTIGKINADGRDYGFSPAILRVNRQIHAESVRVLYGENCWIVFDVQQQSHQPYFQEYPKRCFTWYQMDNFTDFSALRVTIGAEPSHRRKFNIVLPIQRSLPMFLGLAIMSKQMSESLHIALDFEQLAQYNSFHWATLLENLKDVRGLKSLSVEGEIPIEDSAQLQTIMLTPVHRVKELLDRGNKFHTHAEELVAIGRFAEAETLYSCAYRDPASDLTYIPDPSVQSAKLDEDAFYHQKWKHQETNAALEMTFCEIKLGNLAAVEGVWHRLNKAPSKFETVDQKFRLQYYQGLSAVALGKEWQAFLHFREAFKLQTGHEGLDHELDAMEARSESRNTGLKKQIMIYIGRLWHYRHQGPGGGSD